MTIQNHIKRLLTSLTMAGFLLAFGVSGAAADEQLIDQGNGTIKDTFSGLLWVQNPSALPSLIGLKTFVESDQACEDLVHAGVGPNVWRLPTITELKSIYDGRFKNPRVNTNFFAAEGGAYWSQTPYYPGTKAWTMNFKTGFLGAYDKNNPDKPARQYTRCVTRL